MIENFAVVVAPLHTSEYQGAMIKLTELQKEGFLVTQQNLLVLHDQKFQTDNPYCVYWLERPIYKMLESVTKEGEDGKSDSQ